MYLDPHQEERQGKRWEGKGKGEGREGKEEAKEKGKGRLGSNGHFPHCFEKYARLFRLDPNL